MANSNNFAVEVRAQSILEEAATFGAGWTPPLLVPTLAAKSYRTDPEGFPTYPDSAAVWNDSPVYARDKRAWNWTSKAGWDAVNRGVVWVNSCAIETDNPQATMLTVYDERTNVLRIHENPLGYSVGHGFDSNGIDSPGRKLYKWTLPFYLAGSGGNGWLQPQLGVIDLDTLTLDRIIPRSADEGVFADGLDMRSTTAPAIDWFPGVGVVLFSKYRVWICNTATDTWSAPISTGLTNYSFHNVGHYNPDLDIFIFGGGSYTPDGKFIQSMFKLDTGLTITPLDNAPVCLSVNSDADSAKCAFTYLPGTGLSAAFHNDGNIYTLDPTAGTGNQWSTLTGAMDADNASANDRWACAIPTHNCVMLGHFGFNGTSTLKLWRL